MSEEPAGLQDLFESIGKTSFELIGNLAEALAGQAESLRDGSELLPVSLPRDLYAHSGAQTEWWYYTGHCKTTSGIEFGFELVFFKRRTDLDKFSMVPLRLFGNPLYFAHFALSFPASQKFSYSHRKSANGLLDLPAAMSESHYYLRIGDWKIREASGSHILSANLQDGTIFEASLAPSKPPALNGAKGDGLSFKDIGEASRYFSYTKMAAEGDITIGGKIDHFTGSAWMDREFGTWTPTENQKDGIGSAYSLKIIPS